MAELNGQDYHDAEGHISECVACGWDKNLTKEQLIRTAFLAGIQHERKRQDERWQKVASEVRLLRERAEAL